MQLVEDIGLTSEKDFDDLISGDNRVRFKSREKKVLRIKNWRKRTTDFEDRKTGETKKINIFVADVIEENGNSVRDLELRETSKRFSKEIMPIILKANQDGKKEITIAVIKKEDPVNQFGTEYWVEEA